MLRNWEKGEATCILHANAPRREHTAQVSGSMEIRFTHICSGLRFDRFGDNAQVSVSYLWSGLRFVPIWVVMRRSPFRFRFRSPFHTCVEVSVSALFWSLSAILSFTPELRSSVRPDLVGDVQVSVSFESRVSGSSRFGW